MYVCVYINMNNMNLKLTLIDKLEIFKTVFFLFLLLWYFSVFYIFYIQFLSVNCPEQPKPLNYLVVCSKNMVYFLVLFRLFPYILYFY